MFLLKLKPCGLLLKQFFFFVNLLLNPNHHLLKNIFCYLLILVLIALVLPLHSQNRSRFMKITPAGEKIVNTNVDNMAYWKRMVKLGFVIADPKVAVDKPVFKSSIIRCDGIFVQDSPDIPVTGESNTTQSENSIFVSPENEEIVLNSNNSTDWSSGTVSILYGADGLYSTDAASTWAGSWLGASRTNAGDPATAIGLNGWWYIGAINNEWGQSVAYSTNQGASWTDVLCAPGAAGNDILDKNHLWIDNSRSSPYEGYLYDAWTNFVFGSANKNNIEIVRSNNKGLSWSSPVNISTAVMAGNCNQGVNIHTGPGGEVYVVWSIYDAALSDESALGFTKSIDGGEIFTPATRIISNIRGIRSSATNKNMRVNAFPSMCVDNSGGPNNGTIYIVWANHGLPGINTGNDIDVFMIRSSDGGSTWSAPNRVNQDASGFGKQHFFPWITCDPDNGNLSVIYYDDRNVSSTQCETWVSWSNDRGDTWQDFRVSDVAFTPAPIAGLATGYFGDYLGITSKNMKVYPVWTDNRTGQPMTYTSPFNLGPRPNQPYIYFSSVDVVSIGGVSGQTMNFGDSLHLTIGLQNIGDQPASNVNAWLSTLSPYVLITDSSAFYNQFVTGQIKEIPMGYTIKVSDSIPDGIKVRFNIRSTDGDSTWYSHFYIEAHAPALAINQLTINDSAYGNNNHRFDPGETVTVVINTSNTGDFASPKTWGRLTTTSPYLTIESDSVYLGTIQPAQSKNGSYTLTVGDEATNGTGTSLLCKVFSENYSSSRIFQETIAIIDEDWETNTFTKFPWFFGGSADWILTENSPWEGIYCARSGFIQNQQSSELKIHYTSGVDDTISFYRKTSSEADYDSLSFYIDDVSQGKWSGEQPWERVAFPVTAGFHLFTWVYWKDIWSAVGQDCAWIDFIEFPPPVLPDVSAGSSDTICAGQTYQLNGTASNYDTIKWTTYGDGIFNDPTILTPVYTPGTNDIISGSVKLRITAIGVNGNAPSHMYLTIGGIPTAHITFEPNDTLCLWQTLHLYSNASGADKYLWSPGNQTSADLSVDLASLGNEGDYWFKVVATSSLNCSITDSILIHVKECLGIDEKENPFTSEVYPNPNNGIFNLSIQSKGKENIGIHLRTALNVSMISEKNWMVSGKMTRTFDYSYLPSGFYLLELERKGGKITHKVLIRK
jgi:hypothetical protein